MEQINLKAYAKINLALDVVGKRQDGYHEVKMIMQTIRLYDKLSIRKIRENKIKISTNLNFLPIDKGNLVYRAADLLKEQYHIRQGVEIMLEKHIPVSAGLAGGSSDCAAALFGINRLFGLGLSSKRLMELGVKLGADVPYCLMRGTALSEGIGEILTRLPALPDCFILIAKPSINISTKFVYENLNLHTILEKPDIDGMISSLERKNLLEVASGLKNVLEIVTIKEYPYIQEIKDSMLENGALNSLMSGSGATVFGIFDNQRNLERAYEELKVRKQLKQVYMTKPYNTIV